MWLKVLHAFLREILTHCAEELDSFRELFLEDELEFAAGVVVVGDLLFSAVCLLFEDEELFTSEIFLLLFADLLLLFSTFLDSFSALLRSFSNCLATSTLNLNLPSLAVVSMKEKKEPKLNIYNML